MIAKLFPQNTIALHNSKRDVLITQEPCIGHDLPAVFIGSLKGGIERSLIIPFYARDISPKGAHGINPAFADAFPDTYEKLTGLKS